MENLNAEQIIKALECCNVINGCKDCPYSHEGKPNGECSEKASSDVLALIKSQEQKIKELTEEIKDLEADYDRVYEQAEADIRGNMADGGTSCHWCIAGHRADAVRKMAERLTSFFSDDDMIRYTEVDDVYINAQIMKITEYMLREDGK
jgi:hypothetical protein